MSGAAIAWFRRDLRLADNPMLEAAIASEQPVLPVYIRDRNDAGAASDWWLHGSLAALSRELENRNAPLLLLEGDPAQLLPELAKAVGAGTLSFSRGYSAAALAEEDAVRANVACEVLASDNYYLHTPGSVLTADETPYKVFTPFWKACTAKPEPGRPIAAPPRIPAATAEMRGRVREALPVVELDALDLLPTKPDWAGGLRDAWTPGEAGAHARLEDFIARVGRYADCRDRPDVDATSRLSPHLHFGELSPRQVWHSVHDVALESADSKGADAFLRQLYWREFSGHLLFHNPELPAVPLRSEFENFGWRMNAEALAAWQHGRTGVPIVDAGMRELWATGWMHNRVRMVVASFLVKNLLVPWQAGAEWFLDTLVDADLANNSASWQWVAGCGTDAAPYFRIYNPVLQGRKFDPNGRYVRRWVPELRRLADEDLHEPWLTDGLTQRLNGVVIGDDYPAPIVDLARSRERALEAYQDLRSSL